MFRKKAIIIFYSIFISISLLGQTDRNLNNAEYFWDTDPGVGNATPIAALDGSFDQMIEQLFESSLNFPSSGAHVFNIRIQDEDGTWSPAFKRVIDLSVPTQARDLHITQAEYYWDTDPGQGSAIPLFAFDGAFDQALEDAFSFSTPPLNGIHTIGIRAKDINGNWGPTFRRVVVVEDQTISRDFNITTAEYFWDSDPGEGSGTSLLAFDGNFDSAIEQLFESSLNFPSSGAHVFNIRIQDEDGSWSPAFKRVIDLSVPTQARDLHITQAEYYWDTDPGQGSGIPLLAFDGAFDQALEDAFSFSTPPLNGIHTIGIRAKDINGNWSPAFRRVVVVEDQTISRDFNITNAEYFWDSDPGEGSGTSLLAFDGNFDSAIEQLFESSLNFPSSGAHVFNIRIQDEDGSWSPAFKRVIDLSVPTQARDLHITQAEYYWDTDPGQGSGIPLLAFDGAFDQALEDAFSFSTPPLNGVHTLNLRAKDINGIWGPAFRRVISFEIVQQEGCTDSLACNYDPLAIIDDSSCGYYTSSSLTTITACDSYMWNGQVYTNSLTDSVVFTNSVGCDSTAILNLTINYSYTITDLITACDAYVWALNGLMYTTSNNTDSVILLTISGCDSVVYLDLTINDSALTTIDSQVHCDSYTWIDGLTYTASNNTASHMLQTVYGCDSLITLNLTINSSYTFTDQITACGSYTWVDGLTYDSSGTYVNTYSTINGCDSTTVLELIIEVCGCTDSTAFNYNPFATLDDSSCIAIIYGCTNPQACNYDSLANTNNGSCLLYGCTDILACNYDSLASCNDSSCQYPTYTYVNLSACDSLTYEGIYYDSSATYSTITIDSSQNNTLTYCASSPGTGDYATIDLVRIIGEGDSIVNNTSGICDTYEDYTNLITTLTNGQTYSIDVNLGTCNSSGFSTVDSAGIFIDWNQDGDFTDSGEKIAVFSGVQSPTTNTINITVPNTAASGITRMRIVSQAQSNNASYPDGPVSACMVGDFGANGTYNQPWFGATEDYSLQIGNGCGSITVLTIEIFNTQYVNNNFSICNGDSVQVGGSIYYSPGTYVDTLQTINSCDSIVNTEILFLAGGGCTDSTAFNYNPNVNCDDGSCIPFIYGCMDSTMFNYNVSANTDDGSCMAIAFGCTDSLALNFEPLANTDDSTCCGAGISLPPFGTQLGQDIDGEAAWDYSGYSVSLSSDGNTVAIGAYHNDGNGSWSGHVRIYNHNGSFWTQLGNDIDGEAAYDESGNSVSLSSDGNTVAIGAPSNDGNGNNSGHVRIYNYNGTSWIQVGQDIDGDVYAQDYSGYSVSLSSDGNTIAIGTLGNASGGNASGHVRIYNYNGTSWIQVGQDIDGEAVGDYSGWSVSLSSDGNTVAIGAKFNDGINGTNSGHVRIYNYNGSSWTQIGGDIDGEAALDQSGWSVSLSSDGNILAIGAMDNDGNGNNSGHVRIYENNNGTWIQIGQDIDGEGASGMCGSSVSLSSDGNIIAIGAYNEKDANNIRKGHVRVYQNINSTWIQIGYDIDGEGHDDQSGWSVSLSSDGSRVAIGAYMNDGNGPSSGHVRVFSIGTGTQYTSPPCSGCTDSLAVNYDPYSLIDDGTCDYLGCTDSLAFNYDPLATIDDSSCIATVFGCMDSTQFNYNVLANTDDGSCISFVYGCMDSTMFNYNSLANTDDGSCMAIAYGCMDSTACNFDPLANTDNGSCLNIYGCTDTIACNYDAFASCDDGSCLTLYGCTDSTAFNYNANATCDNGSCIAFTYGCMDSTMFNYNPLANVDDGSCIPFIYGCMDSTACNYDPLANTDNGSCLTIYGCTDPLACNFDSLASCDDGSCLTLYGCTDSTAFNFNANATCDNGSCIAFIYGCMDSTAINYNASANIEDSSCIYIFYGCTDSSAINYNPIANIDDGSCIICNYMSYMGIDNLAFSNVSCNGGNDGSITNLSIDNYSYSNGYPPFTYSIDSGYTFQNSNNFYNLSAGYYFLTYMDTNGCVNPFINTIWLQLTEPSPYVYSSTISDISCSLAADGSIQLNVVSGNTSPYSISWSTGWVGNFVSALSAGNYFAYISDANTCLDTVSFYIQEPLPISSSISVTDVSCVGANDGSATINSSGGTPPFTYQWSNGQTGNTAINLSEGSYQVFVTDSANCLDTSYFSISSNPIIITAQITDVSCNGNDGAIDATINGGETPYSFIWFYEYPGFGYIIASTLEDLTNVTVGNYYLQITDANGCIAISDTFIVTTNDILLSYQSTNASCFGGNDGSIDVSISGGVIPYTYQWDNGASTEDISGLSAGTYSLIVTDINNCSSSDTITISEPSQITISANITNVSTNCDGAIDVSVSGGTPPYSYAWQIPSSSIVDSFSVSAVSPSANHPYSNYNPFQVYAIDGQEAQELTLIRGITYYFNMNNIAFFHPFFISTNEYGGTFAGQITNGVTNLNAAGTYSATVNQTLSFTPDSSHADTLYYQCGNHMYMGYRMLIVDAYTTEDLTGLCLGNYSLTVSDSNMCLIITSYSIYNSILGCTDSTALNYNPLATVDDGNCIYCVYGCTDPTATNYNALATCDDGSCIIPPTCTTPISGLFMSDVIHDRAIFNFDNMNTSSCIVDQLRIKYRAVGTSSWSQKNMGSPTGFNNGICNSTQRTDKIATSLNPSTTYQWQMRVWYCSTGATAWVNGPNFTTEDLCPNVINFTATPVNTVKVNFSWDTTTAYSFVRIKLRVDTTNASWLSAGGFGVNYPALSKQKSGLTPGATYRAQARTWCNPTGGAYRSLAWTPLIFWTQPASIKIEGENTAITNLEVYPNPSRDIFNITFTSNEKQDLEIRIINVIGEIIFIESKQQFVGEYTKQIMLGKYPKAIYFLEIETDDGVINKKLILQ